MTLHYSSGSWDRYGDASENCKAVMHNEASEYHYAHAHFMIPISTWFSHACIRSFDFLFGIVSDSYILQ